ncbi:MAG: glycosyl transferase [Deltaproteobacteria bacterium RIFOXYA12_FULL_61_11]|nr:MAG: glycosyl transferase [Deltaproteobacteria bacterium RIFOXYA12_FULL_61_11]
MKVSILIPVFNEAATILEVLERVAAVDLPERELIVIDDGSTDGTRALLRRQVSRFGARLVELPRNRGKGFALRAGFSEARGEIILIQDADLEYHPKDYPQLLEPLLRDYADVVYGSRFQGSKPHRVLFFWHYLGNRLLTLCSNMFTNLNLTDMETGFKAFRREVLEGLDLREDRFGFEPEFTAKIAKRNLRIYEVGISYFGRGYAEGKKIGIKDAVRAIWCIVRYH